MIHKADECDTDILVFGGLSYYEDKGQNGAYSKINYQKIFEQDCQRKRYKKRCF